MPKFIIFTAIIILVFIGLSQKIKTNQIPLLDNVMTKAGTEFSQINGNYPGSTVTLSHDFPLWWISQDGYNIMNQNSPAISLNIPCQGPGSEAYEKALPIATTDIAKIFLDNGFAMNKLNSSTSFTDTQFYDYIQAFNKGNTYCVLVGNNDCFGEADSTIYYQPISVSCTDQFAKNYQEQILYLTDLDIKDAVVDPQIYGNFAYIDVHDRRSGYYIIAKKENNKWVKLFAGQDNMPCELVNKEKVPSQIMQRCWSASEQKTLPNTN